MIAEASGKVAEQSGRAKLAPKAVAAASKKSRRRKKNAGAAAAVASSTPEACIVQRLYETCEEVFAECAPWVLPAVADIARLSDILDRLQPEHVNVSPALICFNERASEGPPVITYIGIYNCDRFSIGIFCLPESAVIPLHNHPGMTVFSKVLFGSVHIKSYDWANSPPNPLGDQANHSTDEQLRLAKVQHDRIFEAPCEPVILYPENGGNMHCFTAVTPCAVLDVMGPPYSTVEGRDCLYFDDFPCGNSTTTPDSSDGARYSWLRARVEAPSSLRINVAEYTGPKIEVERRKQATSKAHG